MNPRELAKQKEKERKIALEIIEIFKSNHLSYLEIENVLADANNIAKNQTYLET